MYELRQLANCPLPYIDVYTDYILPAYALWVYVVKIYFLVFFRPSSDVVLFSLDFHIDALIETNNAKMKIVFYVIILKPYNKRFQRPPLIF